MSPEYKEAKRNFDRLFSQLRDFNALYSKKFARELRAERDRRRDTSRRG